MEYREFIRQLIADILNNKKDYSYITSNRDFFYVQYTLLKMGKIDRVIEMGEIAHNRNISNGINLELDIKNVAK